MTKKLPSPRGKKAKQGKLYVVRNEEGMVVNILDSSGRRIDGIKTFKYSATADCFDYAVIEVESSSLVFLDEDKTKCLFENELVFERAKSPVYSPEIPISGTITVEGKAISFVSEKRKFVPVKKKK